MAFLYSSRYIPDNLTSKHAVSEFRSYIWTVKTYICSMLACILIPFQGLRYMLTLLWACSVVSRVAECPPTSPFSTISFITEALNCLFPSLENFHCLLGHGEQLLKWYMWNLHLLGTKDKSILFWLLCSLWGKIIEGKHKIILLCPQSKISEKNKIINPLKLKWEVLEPSLVLFAKLICWFLNCCTNPYC